MESIINFLSGIPGMLYGLLYPIMPFIQMLPVISMLLTPSALLIATGVLLVKFLRTSKGDPRRSVKKTITIIVSVICAVVWITIFVILALLFTGNISLM